jgi:hypothetical protein
MYTSKQGTASVDSIVVLILAPNGVANDKLARTTTQVLWQC